MRQKLIEVIQLLRSYQGTPLVPELAEAEMKLRAMLVDAWRYEHKHVPLEGKRLANGRVLDPQTEFMMGL